jgi:hypothetical protein
MVCGAEVVGFSKSSPPSTSSALKRRFDARYSALAFVTSGFPHGATTSKFRPAHCSWFLLVRAGHAQLSIVASATPIAELSPWRPSFSHSVRTPISGPSCKRVLPQTWTTRSARVSHQLAMMHGGRSLRRQRHKPSAFCVRSWPSTKQPVRWHACSDCVHERRHGSHEKRALARAQWREVPPPCPLLQRPPSTPLPILHTPHIHTVCNR